MRLRLPCLLLLTALAGCGDGSDDVRVRLTDIDDGAYLRGIQTSTFEVDTSLNVVRVELFLDGERIATDELAPFEVPWDTSQFDEGAHELLARAHLDDESRLDGSFAIVIDNTAPTLAEMATSATRGVIYNIPAFDNLGVGRVEVYPMNGDPVVMTKAPFSFAWPWGCGATAIGVHVFDRAGAEIEERVEVAIADPYDYDCDGYRGAQVQGGDDCDDYDVRIHPGAAEPPEGYDLNCDGATASLAGIDSDGDGVPSFSDGGDDCNDADASVHGNFFRFASAPLSVNDVPLRWSPGDAIMVQGDAFPRLLLNRDGIINEVTWSYWSGTTVTPVATGANRGSIAGAYQRAVFGRGNDVVVMAYDTGWFEQRVIRADQPVGRVAYSRTYDGTEAIVYQAGTKVWLAWSTTSFTPTLLVDVGAPLAQAPNVYAYTGTVMALYRTPAAAWKSFQDGATPMTTRRHGVTTAATTTASTPDGPEMLVAFEQAGQGVVYDSSNQKVLTYSQPVTALHAAWPYLFVRLASGDLEILRTGRGGYRRVQLVPGVTTYDAASGETFATDGTLYYPAEATVREANETSDDGVDRDCDGHD